MLAYAISGVYYLLKKTDKRIVKDKE